MHYRMRISESIFSLFIKKQN